MVRVVLQLAMPDALAVQGRQPPTRGSEQVRQHVQRTGADLRAIHPGATHELLGPFFAIDVGDADAADDLVRRLQGVEGVVACYTQPPIAPP